MSQSTMSMSLIGWVTVPPRPIQNVFWWSFSETRSGSSAFSPAKSGSRTLSAAATSLPSVKTLPWPMTPASVWTAISAWIESSRLISVDQPPFGLSPSSGTETMETMRTGGVPAALPGLPAELVDMACSSVDAMGADEVEIDLDANAGKVGDENRSVLFQLERGAGDAPRQGALADVELDEAGARQGGDELQAEGGEEVGEPGMRHEVDAGPLREMRDLGGDADAAAA